MAEYRMLVFLPGAGELKRKLGVDVQGEVQRYVTAEVMRRLKPYLPLKRGGLRASMTMGPTIIRVSTPYARAQFFGVTRKRKSFEYEPTGPKVGPHWDLRMVAEQGEAIVADARRFAKRVRVK